MSGTKTKTILQKLKEMHGEKFDSIIDGETQEWVNDIDNVMEKYIETMTEKYIYDKVSNNSNDRVKQTKYQIVYYNQPIDYYVEGIDKLSAAYRYITETDYAASYYIIKKEYFKEHIAYLKEQDYFNYSVSEDYYIPDYVYHTLRYVYIDLIKCD
jgi:hypothetical protein